MKTKLTVIVFEKLMFEDRTVLGLAPRVPGSKRVQFSVKSQKKCLVFVGIAWKMIVLKLRMFGIVFNFFWFCLTLPVLEKLKNSIFEIPIIPQILNINNYRTTCTKCIILHIIRKLIEYSFKGITLMTMFTTTAFEILLF